MTTRILILLCAALLAAGPALAEDAAKPPFDPGNYPPAVQKALRYANEECASQGGGQVTFAADTVRKVDLTGDGRDDYIVDFHDTECGGYKTVYCGTGGCTMEILVTLPRGRIRSVFSDRVRSYEILPDQVPHHRGPRTIRFELHGSYCGGHGNPSCVKQKRISAAPFEFKLPD
jgi:hypothetical protein